MNLYVGNLARETTLEELRREFQAHGEVASLTLPGFGMHAGLATGGSRGFAFVVMRDNEQARAAQSALHLRKLHGRPLTVQAERERPARRRRR